LWITSCDVVREKEGMREGGREGRRERERVRVRARASEREKERQSAAAVHARCSEQRFPNASSGDGVIFDRTLVERRALLQEARNLLSRRPVQRRLAHKKAPSSLGPPQGPRHRHRPTVGSWGEVFSYERGTPVRAKWHSAWIDPEASIFEHCNLYLHPQYTR